MSGLVAGLDALVVGVGLLFAMLVVSAVLRPFLVSVLGQAPFIGGWLASNVDSGLNAFQAAIIAPANASLPLVASALNWVADNARSLTTNLTGLLDAVYNSVSQITSATIPNAISNAEQYLEGLIANATATAQGLFSQAEADATLGAQAVLATAQGLFQQAEADALAGTQAAESVVLQEIRKAEQNTAALFLQAEADAALGVQQAESLAAALVASARADALAAVGAVEHDLQALAAAERVALADSVSVLGGDITAAEARANAALAAVDEATRKSIEGILESLPWQSLVAGVEASEAVLRADVTTLVAAAAVEIRKLLGDAEAVRAKYGPQVAAALAQLRKAA